MLNPFALSKITEQMDALNMALLWVEQCAKEKNYKTIIKEATTEFVEKHSKFIGYVSHTKTDEEAVAFIDGIKKMIGKVGEAVSKVGEKIKNFLHFSRPDVGPLRDYETWMPDMIKGMVKGINNSSYLLENATDKMAQNMANKLSLSDLINDNIKAMNDKTVLFVTHRNTSLKVCDRIVHVENKKFSVIKE